MGHLSTKQNEILRFPAEDYDALICDGSIRSGKSSIMSIAFVVWLMHEFNDHNFAICGKTVQGAMRNVITPLTAMSFFRREGYGFNLSVTRSMLTIRRGSVENRVYIFGGKDEGSAALIQGMTLAGVFFDEVALMPKSFVEQALARCSVTGSRFWFNCNPEGPKHWFYTEWIQKAAEKNAKYLHFTMDDNPSLSDAIRKRYESLYTGVFYDRFIRGLWVVAEGLIYSMFSSSNVVQDLPQDGIFYISIDYGTVNAFSAGLWMVSGGKAYRTDEYYYSGRTTGERLTDEEYYQAVESLAGSKPIKRIIVDPSAASFKTCIKRHGTYRVQDADNDVINGIRNVSNLLRDGRLLFHSSCIACIDEFGLYRWDEKSSRDKPVKEHDHAMDETRYFVNTALKKWIRREVSYGAIE